MMTPKTGMSFVGLQLPEGLTGLFGTHHPLRGFISQIRLPALRVVMRQPVTSYACIHKDCIRNRFVITSRAGSKSDPMPYISVEIPELCGYVFKCLSALRHQV